jgi:hypothetical protein
MVKLEGRNRANDSDLDHNKRTNRDCKSRGDYMQRTILLVSVLVLATFGIGCNAAEQGAVKVETAWGKVTTVHQPGDWFTCWSPGCGYADVDMRPWTDDIDVHSGTSDNAGLKIRIKVTGRIKADRVIDYLTTFGFDSEQRHARRYQIETGAVQTIARDAIALHSAYNIYKEQQTIQKAIEDRLKDFYATQLYADLISVQITDRPDFDNDEIENAASKVVAAQKQKEAEQQYKEAAQTRLEKNQIENQIYAQSPQAFELEKLKLQGQIAQAWAAHQGALVFGGNNLQVQVPK